MLIMVAVRHGPYPPPQYQSYKSFARFAVLRWSVGSEIWAFRSLVCSYHKTKAGQLDPACLQEIQRFWSIDFFYTKQFRKILLAEMFSTLHIISIS